MFDQPELEALLRANLKRYPHAVLRGDAEVTDVVQIGADRAQVAFTDRVSGEEHRVETRYVLGCDGANSLVRAAIGACMEDLKFQQRWLVVDVATAAELNQWEVVHQVCDPHRAATYMRIGDTRYRWEFRLLPDETADDYSTMAALYPLIRPWVEGVAPEQLELVRVAEYTFRAQVANRWHRGNMFILGDAAHLTPPFIGQGMGAGLRDATNLAWKLAGVVNGWLPESVLDTYEQERIPHARYMIRFALAMGAAMTAGGEVGNFLRRVVVPRLHLIPGVREKIVDSTTPALHSSAVGTEIIADDGSWRAGCARILFWPTVNGSTRSSAPGSRSSRPHRSTRPSRTRWPAAAPSSWRRIPARNWPSGCGQAAPGPR